jgi:hypothetical protein
MDAQKTHGIDRYTAELLLRGATSGVGSDCPPLSDLLAAAAAPGRPDELTREQASLAAYRVAQLAHTMRPRGSAGCAPEPDAPALEKDIRPTDHIGKPSAKPTHRPVTPGVGPTRRRDAVRGIRQPAAAPVGRRTYRSSCGGIASGPRGTPAG